ncbi:hypothetical protein [Actinosynnema sp. ALI-1.44]|uniref:hypothetical protein n=1 Tax=Actinosynnema sp. ALI-1.44 TaxID=1933779 RepID=UPI00143D4BC9|nr:hypothetical protein [Actinosynnema sp. ALI-1.44]
MTTRVFRPTATPLRARWIVDPTDPAGRRMIAVWAREFVVSHKEELPLVGAVR